MKKVLVLAVFAVACSFTVASAQQGGGDPAARQAAMKQRYKDLGLNDVQVDSVMAINADMRPKMMELRNASEADRPALMKTLSDARNRRLEAALPKDLAKKVEDMMSQPRGNRPPGGGGGN